MFRYQLAKQGVMVCGRCREGHKGLNGQSPGRPNAGKRDHHPSRHVVSEGTANWDKNCIIFSYSAMTGPFPSMTGAQQWSQAEWVSLQDIRPPKSHRDKRREMSKGLNPSSWALGWFCPSVSAVNHNGSLYSDYGWHFFPTVGQGKKIFFNFFLAFVVLKGVLMSPRLVLNSPSVAEDELSNSTSKCWDFRATTITTVLIPKQPT